MEAITLEAQERAVGKKATKAVRTAGNVPCILYGHHADPVAFQIPEASLKQLIYTTEAHIVNIKLDGNEWSCIMKDADLHPVTDRPIHADFLVLEEGEMVTLIIPVRFHGTPLGQKEGGNTQVVLHEVEVRCLPKDIPSHIDVDISELTIGDAIHIEDLSVEGGELLGRPEQTVVTVVPPRAIEVEEEPEVEFELDEEGEPIIPEEGEEEGEGAEEALEGEEEEEE